MEIISFIGIVAALILIILGSVRGYSLILLSTVAALLVAATGGVNVFENYANVYMGGVANMVLALFPIFLGGQMFGKMLEMSGLPMAGGQRRVPQAGGPPARWRRSIWLPWPCLWAASTCSSLFSPCIPWPLPSLRLPASPVA